MIGRSLNERHAAPSAVVTLGWSGVSVLGCAKARVDTDTVIPTPLSFALAPAVRSGAVLGRGWFGRPLATKTRREFLDFVIDGRPLLSLINGADVVSALATDLPASDFTAEVDRLLLRTPSHLSGGRHILYWCPECADLACGAITAAIVRHDKHIIWRDFGWQSDDEEVDNIDGIGPFRFSVSDYQNALRQVLSSLGR